jgi:hypothetical protein
VCFSPKVKRSGLGFDHSSRSSIEVKNVCPHKTSLSHMSLCLIKENENVMFGVGDFIFHTAKEI